MMKLIVLALSLGLASAFTAPRAHVGRVQPSMVAAKDMPGNTNPVGFFDPMGLSSGGSDETILWYRAAELKHSRVAMLACSGWLLNCFDVYWPGDITHGTPFSSLGSKPFEAWENVPYAGKIQMLMFVGLVEFLSEVQKPHYTKGGDMGLQCDPLGIYNQMSAEERITRQNRELNNGRLAMIGIISFFSAANVPGSVPAIPQ
eukprot:CAMPEP_0185748860 /NCGR_PEP_ID=MMETSP1174-20130828/7564_1 /TAXON_ID=35687 /ORGANISM="Dictyocha speculum, Strain CCMP1381" /LENGTH=201 /DNA_ID=CAMNT_0028424723 /DNA_START=35 /DNA_END=640 /DNA_ORIENTATION=-